MRANDLTARFGGDEFVIALNGLGTADKARKVAKKVLDDIVQPFALDNGELVTVSASVGIAFTTTHDTTSSALLDAADAAMYEAKQQGKNCIAVTDSQLTESMAEDAHMGIKAAFDRGEIELFFQPVLSLATNEVVSVRSPGALASSRKGGSWPPALHRHPSFIHR